MNIDRPEHYFEVSLDRSRQSKDLYEECFSFALSMYVSGLAVESMFRALALRNDPELVSRADTMRLFKGHDLSQWFAESGLGDADQSALRKKGLRESQAEEQFLKIRAAVNDVCQLWSNLLRYASESTVKIHLKKIHQDRGIMGSYLKENARRLFSSSQILITAGERRWSLLTKSKRS